MCFWFLAYLMHDPENLAAITAEIRPAFKNDVLDMAHLLNHCPLLSSFYEEILRIVNE